LFWSVSGGTVLSVAGFVAMIGYQQYSDSLAELRNDLKRFNEARAELVTKDSLRERFNSMKEHIKELREANLNGLRESQTVNLANHARDTQIGQLEKQVKSLEDDRKEMAQELQRLRERLAAVEGRQAAIPIPAPVANSSGK
jgi:chromosome segregation ATPase